MNEKARKFGIAANYTTLALTNILLAALIFVHMKSGNKVELEIVLAFAANALGAYVSHTLRSNQGGLFYLRLFLQAGALVLIGMYVAANLAIELLFKGAPA